MAEQVRSMFAEIAPRYDLGNRILSMGIDVMWRKRTVRESKASPGDKVLDCATGTGDLALEFKKRVGPAGEVLGTDFCAEMLEFAPSKAEKAGLPCRFEVADAMNLPYEDNSFDVASIAFGIRNVDDPLVCLKEMSRVVKPGGQVVVLEFGQPQGLFKYPYNFYNKNILPSVGSLVTGKKTAYTYLHETSAAFPCGQDFLDIMKAAGSFAEQRAIPLTFGVAYLYIGTVS